MKVKVIVGLMALLLVILPVFAGCAPAQVPAAEQPAPAPAAPEQEVFEWRVQTLWPPGAAVYPPFHEFGDMVYAMSGGRLKIETFTSGALVGTFDKFDAAVDGVISGFHSFSPYWSGKDPAFSMLSPVHSFPEAWMMEAWYMEGGGLELARELYAQHDLFYVGPVVYGSDSMHFSKPWESLADFQGLKIRTPPGMSTDFLTALGASPVTLPPGEIYHALETGVIDAVDFLSLSTMYGLGIHEVAPYFMTRSIMEPTGISSFVVRMDLWQALPADLQAIVEAAVASWSREHLHRGELADLEAREAMLAAGLTEVFVPEEEKARVMEIAMDTWADWGARSPMAGRIEASMREFMQRLEVIE